MLGLVLVALLSGSPDANGWEQILDGDVKIFTRALPGARVKEIRGTVTMPVTALQVREVLVDEEYTRRAPYIGEFRTVDQPAPNRWIRYTRLALPVVDDRDYFIELTRESDLNPDGSGTYRMSWKPWGLDRPARKGIVRMSTNSGYWLVKATADGAHAEVEYYLNFDPGGFIPGWAVERGNKSILPDVLNALQKEAIRRRDLKAAAAK